MKEFLDLYRLGWASYGGNKAFYNGQLFGVGFVLFMGAPPLWFTLVIWGAFTFITLGTQVYVVLRENEAGSKEFEEGRQAIMVRSTLSQFLYTGFALAMVILHFMLTYWLNAPTS